MSVIQHIKTYINTMQVYNILKGNVDWQHSVFAAVIPQQEVDLIW